MERGATERRAFVWPSVAICVGLCIAAYHAYKWLRSPNQAYSAEQAIALLTALIFTAIGVRGIVRAKGPSLSWWLRD